ncbi:HEPN family nuclease [Photobacterium indicum]|uniref:pEK499-p136 HEPN domain-containing protein n=1 Tax=Photobacterium indicum TaxID=81447 RepID=A0A2T3LEU8_9GAMM|nr:HEPN family nuclease [Photobacterium indicum]PSV49849.1 hypothetical protein C9J47_04675 [Photobacterium indicum]
MGNYNNFEPDFVSRTIDLIEQYYAMIEQLEVPFEKQFNYTLTLNCLLGLIVMPKEREIRCVPNTRLTADFKNEMGLNRSILPDSQTTLRRLIEMMRHSVAHFDIEVESTDEHNLVNFVNFKDTASKEVYARFSSDEILPFLKFYAERLVENIHQKQQYRELA